MNMYKNYGRDGLADYTCRRKHIKNACPYNATKAPTTSGWTKTERPKPYVGHKSMPKHVTKT